MVVFGNVQMLILRGVGNEKLKCLLQALVVLELFLALLLQDCWKERLWAGD